MATPERETRKGLVCSSAAVDAPPTARLVGSGIGFWPRWCGGARRPPDSSGDAGTTTWSTGLSTNRRADDPPAPELPRVPNAGPYASIGAKRGACVRYVLREDGTIRREDTAVDDGRGCRIRRLRKKTAHRGFALVDNVSCFRVLWFRLSPTKVSGRNEAVKDLRRKSRLSSAYLLTR